ncbi:uncharacterized protein PHACADRAFT_258727 [Phanerochaete carnosa HHB-10118-sp]|uniref:Muskelin N-terminal domain-containing protein n=1 Tax=Phanerochaete carnosa (strain HHB-10118-sp) TaxID=650164 RepID=K5W6X2_PHACS|nr:uncharacterized protein PHACADRAFT_258727 [Phanerochaete carnosa HHB-10118-sp]EKM54709.1 hypothetical protein PHACADRAFT_258727 [Phanerochaete carnosa HHB-10118-sp]
MDTSQQPPTVQLTYTIASGTEHSGRYVADNILHDNPLDQSSRWSGAAQSSNVQQYLLLRLDSPAVLS